MTTKEFKTLDKKELTSYKKTIKKAFKALNKKNMSLIVHGPSFPSISEQDTGVGSPNTQGAKELVNFASGLFNSIQLGPAGKTKAIDSSPYTGTIFSNNTLFIDLEELTKRKWGSILSKETYERIIENNPNKDVNKMAYSYVFDAYEAALQEAYANYKAKVKKSAALKEIEKAFKKYVKQNKEWLEKDAVYEALIIKNENDYWPIWKDEIDKNLYNPRNEEEKALCEARLKEVKKQYKDEIAYYEFCQYISAAQKDEAVAYANKKGIKMIADRQVAFSDRDVWANQSLFMEGWCLGCPPDYFSKTGQAWGFPVIAPEKIFDEHDNLQEGGLLLKALFKKMFKENPGGVRIDHIVGLIDPWVYKKGSNPMPEEGAGRLYSSPEHSELYKYANIAYEDLDLELESDKEKRVKNLNDHQIYKYGRLMEKIVIEAAKEEGLDKDSIICEDLGTLTNPVEAVMKALNLNGMRLTQFVKVTKPDHIYRCHYIESNQWAMVGTHDNQPISFWAKEMVNTHDGYLHGKNLAEDLLPEEKQQEVETFACGLSKNKELLKQTKLVELFVCPSENIQIFFSDFFGIDDVYNKPGTSGDKNWALRIPNNFEEFYYSQLSKKQGMNLPLLLKLAIESKGSKFIEKNQKLIDELNKAIDLF